MIQSTSVQHVTISKEDQAYYLAKQQSDPSWRPRCPQSSCTKAIGTMISQRYGFYCTCCGYAVRKDMTEYHGRK